MIAFIAMNLLNLWFWVSQGMIQLRNLKWSHTYWIFSPFSSKQVHCQQTHLVCSMNLWNLTQLPIEPCHPTHRWTTIFCIVGNWMLILSIPNELQGNLFLEKSNKIASYENKCQNGDNTANKKTPNFNYFYGK